MAVSGVYDVMVEAIGISGEGWLEIAEVGSTIQGVLHIKDMDIELVNGSISGNNFSCAATAQTSLGAKKFKITGTVDGDNIRGSFKTGLISGSFAGTRRPQRPSRL
ncbi:MAG: hypothetical protein Q4C09_07520 [Atopobiaceae bacterium]|nr:hypothetical protein [Atopobiaceae bacterium]